MQAAPPLFLPKVSSALPLQRPPGDSPVPGLKDLPEQGEQPQGHQGEGHRLQPLRELVVGEGWGETRSGAPCVKGPTGARKSPPSRSLPGSGRLARAAVVTGNDDNLSQQGRGPGPLIKQPPTPGIVLPALKHWKGGRAASRHRDPHQVLRFRGQCPPPWLGGVTKGAEFSGCGTNLAHTHTYTQTQHRRGRERVGNPRLSLRM